MSEHILIIEDDLDIANIERDYLMVAGYDVTIMTNGTDGIEAALNTPVDLIILDVMLPEMDGFEVCRQIRDKVRVPIVMVTARLDDIDKIRGLGVGADDYIEKPFSPSVLIAKIKAMLAQYKRLTERDAMETNAIQSGEIRLDPKMMKVWVNEKEVHLKKKEFQLLEFLMRNRDIVFTEGAIKSNPWRPVMDLSEVDFPYANLKKFENRIIYYESSRGCPFSCSYCLSSIDKRLRFRNLDLVKKELAFFLEQKVPQVKFVDRTFNCKKDHAMAIWKFIAEHDNGVTNFHFEIAADLITEEELELLNTLRPGLVQLEIGVQSTNPQTIEAIHRKMDFGRVTEIVNRIAKGRNIHQHLDLIAGLPYEDYDSFRRSFADVYALRPQQLQLGFLKVLRGSFMYEHTEEYDCHYQEREPYEVLYTKWLPYDDVLKLKDVEEMVEVYYNSGQFVHTLPMIERLYENPFDFFQELGDFYRAKGYSEAAHNRIQRYEILLEFLQDEKQQDEAFFRQIMVLDLYARENMKTRPRFAKDPSEWKNESRDFYQKEAETRTLLPSYTTYDWKQLQRMTHVEVFDYDVLGNGEKARTVLLFDYQKRDPLTGNAEMIDCSEFFYA